MVDLEGACYKPSEEYVEDSNESLINLTDSTELLFLKLPFPNDLLSDIHGKKLFLTLSNDGKLASFEGSSGKVYDFVSFAAQEPDETVFVSSAIEPKIGKISKRVSTIRYPDPKELENLNSTNARHRRRSSSGVTVTTSSRYFPMQSGGRAASSKGSRQRSLLSEVGEPSGTSRKKRASKSKSTMSEDPPPLMEDMYTSHPMVTALVFPPCPQIILLEENQREENIRNNVSFTRHWPIHRVIFKHSIGPLKCTERMVLDI